MTILHGTPRYSLFVWKRELVKSYSFALVFLRDAMRSVTSIKRMVIMKKILIVILVLMLVLAGCNNTSTKEQVNQFTEEPASNENEEKPIEHSELPETIDFIPENLEYNDFIEDYDYFWNTLNDNYPFLGVAERVGIDLEEIQRKYRGKISESTSLKEFSSILDEMMSKFNYVGHMSFISPNSYPGYYKLYSNIADPLNPSHTDYLVNILLNPKSIASYKYISGEELNLDETHDNATYNPPMNTSDNVETKILKDNEIAYVKVLGFGYDDIENDGKILLPFYESINDYPHLIIDIRGNGGGSDRYWNENIALPLITKEYTLQTLLLYNNTPQIMEYIGLDNFEEMSVPLEEIKNDLPNLNQDDRKYLTDAVVIEQYIEPETPSEFNGKIWLLVDGDVYSSSESFTMACKLTGFATIIGTNTGGDGMGIDPMMFSLPNTGLIWRNSIFYSVNPDGSNNEEIGTIPDICIREGEDALKVCMGRIVE